MEIFMDMNFIMELLGATLRMATPLLLCALGSVFSERCGLNNIGLEGLMTAGAVAGFIGVSLTGSNTAGFLLAIVFAVLVNMVFAVASIKFNANQIVIGMAINILAAGLATTIYRLAFGISTTPAMIDGLKNINIPVLCGLPLVGVLFKQNIFVYITYALVPVCHYVLFHTRLGLNLRAVGEQPKAADSMGINVSTMRYVGSILCGSLAGLAGAYLSVGYMNVYVDNLVSGRGYIALAAVIFGRWKPAGILLAALLFGFTDALQLRLQALGTGVSYHLFMMLPYVITLVTLVCFVGKSVAPAANGTNYQRENH
ncbi:ABC transporter permease [Chakrabartyella piscis]|uniref:ABC transporter permease n=1 Tax=Chakrabartyella piscis TaxID=2918914 RepID=UPI0029589D4C|nr:ABC transporter permease [Chakrabartyella piscis]